MKEYRVIWEIDVDATSLVEAAQTAQSIMQERISMAKIFTVIAGPQSKYRVDLGEGHPKARKI